MTEPINYRCIDYCGACKWFTTAEESSFCKKHKFIVVDPDFHICDDYKES